MSNGYEYGGDYYNDDQAQAIRQARGRPSRANALASNVGRAALWRSSSLPVTTDALRTNLRLGDFCEGETHLRRLILAAVNEIETRKKIAIALQVREMTSSRFPCFGLPVKLDMIPVWDTSSVEALFALVPDVEEMPLDPPANVPAWKQEMITTIRGFFTQGVPPFEIAYKACDDDEDSFICESDKFKLSTRRDPAKIQHIGCTGWPWLCTCCEEQDRVRIRYLAGYIDQESLECENPSLFQNILMVAGWLHENPEMNRAVDFSKLLEFMNSLSWRAG